MKQRPGDQPLPTAGRGQLAHAALADQCHFMSQPHMTQVAADLMRRQQLGIERYGQPLQPFNGRNQERDLYEELLDAAAYAKNGQLEAEELGDSDRAARLAAIAAWSLAQASAVAGIMQARGEL